MNMRVLLRMAKWAKNPPSAKQVKLMLAVLLACLVLFGYERLFGWPDWLQVDSAPRRGFKP